MISTIDHIVINVKDIAESGRFYDIFLPSESKSEDVLVYNIGEVKLFLVMPETEFILNDKDKSGMNHIAFRVNDLEDLQSTQAKLDVAGIKNSGVQINKYSQKEYVWFDDPNGYRLEFFLR